jgi:cell division protein ZapB
MQRTQYTTIGLRIKNNIVMSELDYKALELKINQLIGLCRQLDAQNKALMQEKVVWKTERAKILQQKDNARTKVDAMITRLKAMEH